MTCGDPFQESGVAKGTASYYIWETARLPDYSFWKTMHVHEVLDLPGPSSQADSVRPEPQTLHGKPSPLNFNPSTLIPVSPTLKLARARAGTQGFEDPARRLSAVLQGGTSLPDYSQRAILGVRYKFVYCGAEKSPISLDR